MRNIRRRRPKGQQAVDGKSFPAPTGGWDAYSPIADMPIDRAIRLDNWFPTPNDVRVRRGYSAFCDTGTANVIDTLMVYNGLTAAASKMFAASNDVIYDVTTGTASSSVTSMTNNRWQWTNFTTSGGKFLWICNGADQPRHFDGSTWAVPSLTITNFADTDIINVNAHKNRLWFVFKDSTKAGYLPTGSIAGTVSEFELGDKFTKGGYLVAMATWSKDSGNGPDDLAVFISSEGQCAVYQGTDPSSADTWSIIGVFDLGPPIGRRCFCKVAGDIALVNIDGVLPISKALQQDRGAAVAIAITKNINNAMNDAARSYKSNFGWQLTPYPKGTYVVLNVPISEGAVQYQFVMNTLTGAWCRFTGQNGNCWVTFKDDLYFGGNDGVVNKADTGGMDGSDIINAVGQQAYSFYGSPGIFKQWKGVQPIISSGSTLQAAIGLSTDFKDNAALGTPGVAQTDQALYDSAIYDTDVYAAESVTVAEWESISGEGYCASIHFRAQKQSEGELIMAINGFNVIYEKGLVL